MSFHRRTLELLDKLDLLLDRERGAAAARAAATVGIVLPQAVIEWYCVPKQSEIWTWYKSDHWLPLREEVGTPQSWCSGRRIRDESRDDWWLVPSICRDLRGWLKAPIVPLMYENQGCWWWGIVLDGTADPPTAISYDEGETWDTCAFSFSDHVYTKFFDDALWSTEGVERHFWLEEYIHGKQRLALRDEFHVEPTTRRAGNVAGVFTERFSGEGQRFSFYQSERDGSSNWRLWAISHARFANMLSRLGRIFPVLATATAGEGPELSRPPIERGDTEIPF